MQHELHHICFNATPDTSSSQFGMAVVETICAGILLPSTGPDVTTKYKRLSGLTRQAFCFSGHCDCKDACQLKVTEPGACGSRVDLYRSTGKKCALCACATVEM